MKILVTGATGFIGSAFARLAVQRGHEIGGLISPGKNPPAILSAPTPRAGRPNPEKLTWLKGTLADLPWREIESFRPDTCVHFAWIATPGVYLESPENEKHLEWSLALARRLQNIGLKHFVGVGTCIEYQITQSPLSETHTPIAPTTLYARCKNTLREILETESRHAGAKFCWGRVFYPYGVGEHPARLCSTLIQKFRRGEKLTLKTPHSTKDYIYIDDLAAAILVTVEKQFQGPINWGTGAGSSVRHIADTVATMLGRPELVTEVAAPESDPLGYVVADATRLKNLGWQPQFSLEAGLQALQRSLSECVGQG